MAERFTAALDELDRRTTALNVTGDEGDAIGAVFGKPDEIVRQVILGYVPTEDADQAALFTDEVAEAMLRMIAQSATKTAALAGLRLTVAQVLTLGVMLERTEGTDEAT